MKGLTCKNCFSDDGLESAIIYKHSKGVRQSALVLKIIAIILSVVVLVALITALYYFYLMSEFNTVLFLYFGISGVITFSFAASFISIMFLLVSYALETQAVYKCKYCFHYIKKISKD
jgi:uncharacterized membrane protein YesL